MSKQQLVFHSDPGHGWLEVPMTSLVQAGVHEEISGYSYVSRDRSVAYLEEDCDAIKYMKAIGYSDNKEAFEVIELNTNNDSFIRRLRSYPGPF